MTGSLTICALASHVSRLHTASVGMVADRAGHTGQAAAVGPPLTYDSPLFNVTAQGRYDRLGVRFRF